MKETARKLSNITEKIGKAWWTRDNTTRTSTGSTAIVEASITNGGTGSRGHIEEGGQGLAQERDSHRSFCVDRCNQGSVDFCKYV